MTYRIHHHPTYPKPATPKALAAEACSHFALRLRARYSGGQEAREAQRELDRRRTTRELGEDPHALD